MTPDREKLALEALKPCPFCGADGDELMVFCDPSEGIDNSGPSRRIQCAVCNIEAPFYDTKAEAVAAWNRRALLAETAPSGEGEPVACTYCGEVADPPCTEEMSRQCHRNRGRSVFRDCTFQTWPTPAPTPSASEDRAGEVCGYLWEAAYEGEPLTGRWIFSRHPPTRDLRATAFAVEPLVRASALTAREETIARLTRERDEAVQRYATATAEAGKLRDEAARKASLLHRYMNDDVYTSSARAEKRAEAAEARLAVMGEAARRAADILHHNLGRQAEKLYDVEPILRAALTDGERDG